ncbi:hypothetical protein IFM89_012171, partial [Coptis chinensis]
LESVTGSLNQCGSKELITNKPNDVLKPSQRSELVNEEFGQRQNKPRRYSEMNRDVHKMQWSVLEFAVRGFFSWPFVTSSFYSGALWAVQCPKIC